MSNIPADTIHGHEALASIFFRNAFDASNELSAGEAELKHEWMGHCVTYSS
jgi:hypothetical protein